MAPTESLFSMTSIQPFNILLTYRIGLLMYKLNVGNAPSCLKKLFKNNSEIHNYNTRQRHHLHTHRAVHEFTYRTFVFQSVYIWNCIIENININTSFYQFKLLLKQFLNNNTVKLRYDK